MPEEPPKTDPVKTYKQVHAGLFWAHGKAAEHLCAWCLEGAKHWCYIYTAGVDEIVDERNRKYAVLRDNARRACANFTPEQRQLAGQRGMAVRRRCATCDMVSTAPGIGRHQKFSGHVGYVDLEKTASLTSAVAAIAEPVNP